MLAFSGSPILFQECYCIGLINKKLGKVRIAWQFWRICPVLLILKPVCLQNNTACRLFHDIVTDFTKTFYFRNVICFHGTRMNVILFTPFPLASIFTNLIKYQQYYVQISLCRMSPRSTVNVESTDRNSFTSRKLLLRRFSWNSLSHNFYRPLYRMLSAV